MFLLSTATSGGSPEALAAIQRLLEIAHRGTGQSRIAARFLLNLYNGDRFPFDLTDFRCLDPDIFKDCLVVLLMDYRPKCQVHVYIKDGQRIWEAMAVASGFIDHDSKSWR
ncbi:hypothetical protein N5C43_19140 [Comamonas terrigena]|uniref:DUF7673 family protein n=1 Tax=Comamonas terrigena TaxID=32013 RepID=UPI0024487A3B|nr:hypothetical protein [Comamonas terrigena]MDH1293366.1 hypothetical protein [Comamonas terrigena]